MQETRQYILEILRDSGQATVDDIVNELRKRRGEITPVTVRHHLARLQEDDLITTPHLLHRSTPGRPQHVYALTERAAEFFPNNYQQLAKTLIQQINGSLPPENINVIFDAVADDMTATIPTQGLSMADRLTIAVDYLNDHGYIAEFENTDDGYLLHTRNCPYHAIVSEDLTLCNMDMRVIAKLVGTTPRIVSRVSEGGPACTYLVPNHAD